MSAEKSRTNIDDEIYNCIKENDKDINSCFDISIQLNEDELEDVAKPMQVEPPKFLISNPVSMRPSQFPMNETKTNDMTITKNDVMHTVQQSFREIQLSSSKLSNDVAKKDECPPNPIESTEIISQKREASIYMPELPENTTMNMSKYLRQNESMTKPPAAPISHDNSIFMLPKEDGLTDVFSTNLIEEKTEAIPKPPNADMSMAAVGNLSAFPMIPEMPTMPKIGQIADAPKNVSIMGNKSQVMNRTKTETIKTEKKLPDTSIENITCGTANITTGITVNSIHIKEERLSPPNKKGEIFTNFLNRHFFTQ